MSMTRHLLAGQLVMIMLVGMLGKGYTIVQL